MAHKRNLQFLHRSFEEDNLLWIIDEFPGQKKDKEIVD